MLLNGSVTQQVKEFTEFCYQTNSLALETNQQQQVTVYT